jgi:small-conductance mechanosensitive channel
MKSLMFGTLAVILLFAGCASPRETGSRPKPGTGISEYRELTRDAHRSVAAVVASVNAMAQPQPDTAKPHPALAEFDRAMENLELTSYKTRSRAEAILVRGDAYFEEWKEQLNKNQKTTSAESDDYARLHAHFNRIRERSSDVRTEFRPFMARLREFRAAIGKAGDGRRQNPPVAELNELSSHGKRVIDALDAVSKALDDAESEIRRNPTSNS